MKPYDTEDIRNVGLLSHGGAGKTSLAEAMLFGAGVTTRLGKVDEGTSLLDFEPEEHKRGATTKTSIATIEYGKCKINLVDTPGVADFFADTREALIAMDAAVILVSAPDGIEVGTSRCWNLLSEHPRPCAFVISKIDRSPERFAERVEEIRAGLSTAAVAVQLPILEGGRFVGLVDLLHLRAWRFSENEKGDRDPTEVPPEMAQAVQTARVALMESVAETDEALLERYFEEGELSDEDFTRGFRQAFARRLVSPIYATSGIANEGARALLDSIVEVFPSPALRPSLVGVDAAGEPVEIGPSADAPAVGYVFKTLVDPYAGTISITRIFSGRLGGDGVVTNTAVDESERYSALYTLCGKKLTPVSRAVAGDVVALTKLKETRTRHTLAMEPSTVRLEGVLPKEPVISFAVVPRTQSDEAKVSQALQRLLLEDVALQVGRDEQSKHFLLSGMGQLHIETSVDKLQRKFGVAVALEPPRVPYRETIRKKVERAQGRHKKQTGGAGQFGEVIVDIEPSPRGAGFEFEDAVVGGAVPRNYIPAVEKGFAESMERGFLAGFPVVDLRVRLHDGSYHAVDSSEMAFKQAAWLAFKAGMARADPCLLEPIMNVEVVTPDDSMGDVMGDLSSRRGRVQGMDTRGRMQLIQAKVPMAEMLRYALDLKSMTSGRGEFHMELSHYDVVPDHLAQKVIDEQAARRKEEG